MSDNLTDGHIYVAYSHVQNAADDMVSQTRARMRLISIVFMAWLLLPSLSLFSG